MPDASAVLLALPAQAPQWRRSLSSKLVRSLECGDARRFARTLRRLPPFSQLRGRRRREEFPAYQQVLWSRHAFEDSDRSRRLADLLAAGGPADALRGAPPKRRTAALHELLNEYDAGPAPDGFELLAWLTILLHEPSLTEELFLRLWRTAWAWMQPVLAAPAHLAGRLTADQRAVLLGELPWTYGLVFGSLRGARRAHVAGARQLRRELREICDDDGMPHAPLLRRLPLCIAPFTRAANLGELLGTEWRDRSAQSRYGKLVWRAAALLQPDGRTALSNGVAPTAGPLLKSSIARAGLKKSHHAILLASLLTGPANRDEPKKHRGLTAFSPQLKRKHRPSAQSDRAQLACLRNNWGVGADTCIIPFDGPIPRINLTAFGNSVLSGEWRCDTSERWFTETWECVCWFSDSNVDYLELQQVAPAGRRVLRQALLSRNDHFLLLCDVVHASAEAGGIVYSSVLPLQRGTSAQRDALTREWRLQAGPLRVRVLPLGLPQAGLHRADGNLTIDEQAVTLTQSTTGSRLACPLLLDWSPTRRKSPCQWRQLTVAESGRILAPDEALGVRWRIGDSQWLYYHTLEGSDASQTVLGMHTFQETVIAELSSDGDIEHLVQVERKSDEA